MHPINEELKGIKKIIKKALTEHKYKMLREPDEGEDKCTLVTPRVCIGNLPHSNFSLYGASDRYFQAPYILVGYESATADDEEESISILIQACAYTQEEYDGEDDEATFPDNMGILDVTALLEMIARWLEEEGSPCFSRPYEIGSYSSKEFTYPYAFGYLKFDIETGIGSPHQARFYE